MMGRWVLSASLALAVGVAAAGDAAAVDGRLDTLFGEHRPYREFLADLQHAVAEGPRERVARLVSYPLRTTVAGRRLTLSSAREFLAHYDKVLPPASITAIRDQLYGELFANANGVMIGSGEVWFSAVCSDEQCHTRPIRIVALNPPAEKTP
jgi:hypothetical protein